MTPGLPPMQTFRDVPVVPVVSMDRLKGFGGPVWPDFEAQTAARFRRNGIPGDQRPAVPDGPLRRIARPAVWGGFLIRQFGHLAGEAVTRLPQSLAERPGDLCLFTVEPGLTRADLPAHVLAVLDWLGVPRAGLRIVTEPVLAAELRVAAQGEMLGRVPPAPAYLDLLEDRARRNGLRPEPAGVVFVTRAGMVAAGHGGHAGEGYLAALLARLGVRVIDPGRMALPAQMAAYAGAEVLVFSEGSALHGRCLLGRAAQDVHVLRRRPRRDTARAQLAARCRRLVYHEALSASLGAARTGGRTARVHLALALYDLETVFALFAGLGIDLGAAWDHAAYAEAVHADIAAWSARVRVSPAQAAINEATLGAAGLASALMPRRRPAARHACPH